MAGDEHDGRSTPSPATGSSVPTRDELRARWTCHCELLGLVKPKRPGSHTAAAVLCPDKVKAGEGAGLRVGDVTEILVPAMPADVADLPKNVHSLWTALQGVQEVLVTWALCLRARSRPNSLWGVLYEDQLRDKTIGKTVLVPEPWESWAIRAADVRGVWAGWSGEPAKPDVFRVRGVLNAAGGVNLNYTETLKHVKSLRSRTGA